MSDQTNKQIASENPHPNYDNVTRRPDPERLNHLFGCPIREITMPENWLFALVTDSYGVVCKADGQLARLIWDETNGKFQEDKTEHEQTTNQ